MATREEMKNEAVSRMKMIGLHKNAIDEFDKDNILNVSENGGFLYWLDDEQKKRVSAFEEKYGGIVYHVIRSTTCDGDEHEAYLYVSKYDEEWEYDREDLKAGFPLAYVNNLNCDWCSEFGAIGVESNIGGLRRVA